MKPVLEVNQLHVALNSRKRNYELVKGVTFSVMPGECLGMEKSEWYCKIP